MRNCFKINMGSIWGKDRRLVKENAMWWHFRKVLENNFTMGKDAFHELVTMLDPYIGPKTTPNYRKLSTLKKLAMVLYYLKDTWSLWMTSNSFGVHQCTVSKTHICQWNDQWNTGSATYQITAKFWRDARESVRIWNYVWNGPSFWLYRGDTHPYKKASDRLTKLFQLLTIFFFKCAGNLW